MIVARSKDAAAWISQAFVERSRKAKDPSYKGIAGIASLQCRIEELLQTEMKGLIQSDMIV